MTCKKLFVAVLLLSVFLGVDAKGGRSPRKTEKLYRKAGKWQRKLRDVWALLGVKPFLVQPGEEGDECVLKSKVEEDYVLKGAAVFTQGDVDAEVAAAVAAKDDEIAAIGRGIVANYMSNDVVEATYVLKTCAHLTICTATCPTTSSVIVGERSPPTSKQFKAGMNEDTVCGDPTGQTDCATECSEEIPPLNLGDSCYYDDECASGSCKWTGHDLYGHEKWTCECTRRI